MPIWKSDDDGVLMIEMGFGDVCVASGKIAGKEHDDEIVFYSGAKGAIGDTNAGDIGKMSDQVKASCRIVFHDPRSIDAVLHHLNEIKKSYPSSEEPKS